MLILQHLKKNLTHLRRISRHRIIKMRRLKDFILLQ